MNRPVISNYDDIVGFVADMIAYRKATEKSFSVLRITKSLRRLSPALISLILKRQRTITVDRADELAKLLALAPHERQYFKDWVTRLNGGAETSGKDAKPPEAKEGKRKATSSHILTDWINVYVKDAFQLSKIKNKPDNIYAALSGLASQARIDKALNFLLRAGYLRRALDGKIVEDTPLHVVDQRIPDQKVRSFHKATLRAALSALDLYPANKRFANALIIPLSAAKYQELTQLIEEFAGRLQDFAEKIDDGDNLYQLIINLSPTGGMHD